MCELVERQGVSIGQSYRNDKACSTFLHSIAKDLQLQLLDTLSNVNFSVSSLMKVQTWETLKKNCF